MNRYKFRARSELDNKMHQCDMEEDIQSYFKHDDGIILMQWTGLKDCKGDDIYEGDVVKWTSTHSATPVERTDCVTWDNGNSCYFLEPFIQCPGDAIMEVIGNIHQNPELI